ncbi:hypothetical protein T09_12037 [Trichinella sp. T9]|nr:hypothetical protein T09_12037 [Trichinella sp. T9]
MEQRKCENADDTKQIADDKKQIADDTKQIEDDTKQIEDDTKQNKRRQSSWDPNSVAKSSNALKTDFQRCIMQITIAITLPYHQ